MNKNWFDISSTPDRKIETVFKVEPPLMPIKDGHGYAGVLLRDVTNDLLQCHVCGIWSPSLSNHIHKHDLITAEYRKKFSLPASCPLQSQKTLEKHSKRASSRHWKKRWKKMLENMDFKRHTSHKKKKAWKYGRNNLGYLNKLGLCPEQMLRRFMIVSDTIGGEPGVNQLEKYDPKLFAAIRRRYGNLNKFRKKHGFKLIHKPKMFSSDEILGKLRNFQMTYKRLPKPGDFAIKGSHPTMETIRNHFGSFNKAMSLAGLQ